MPCLLAGLRVHTSERVDDAPRLLPCNSSEGQPGVERRGHVIRAFLTPHEVTLVKVGVLRAPVSVDLIGQLVVGSPSLQHVLVDVEHHEGISGGFHVLQTTRWTKRDGDVIVS